MNSPSKLVILATAFALAVSACSDSTDAGAAGRVPVVQIAERDVTLSPGDSTRVTLLPLLPPGIIPQDVRWSSSDPAIVTVRRVSSTAAVATAMRAGRVVVHADAVGARDSVVVTVQ